METTNQSRVESSQVYSIAYRKNKSEGNSSIVWKKRRLTVDIILCPKGLNNEGIKFSLPAF